MFTINAALHYDSNKFTEFGNKTIFDILFTRLMHNPGITHKSSNTYLFI